MARRHYGCMSTSNRPNNSGTTPTLDDKMDFLILDPKDIKVKEGLSRMRQDLGDLSSLAKSLERTSAITSQPYGNILPIVINRDNELIDGGRRLAASILVKLKVRAVYQDAVDPYIMRELEVEANLHRKDFTPAERGAAIEELHRLKTSRYGETKDGVTGGWTLEDTAKTIGMSRKSVQNALEIAQTVSLFPELAKAKKASQILKARKGLERVATAMENIKKHEELVQENLDTIEIVHADAVEHMLSIPSNSIDILLTDPIYGIDADKTMQTIGGETGGALNNCGYKIEDDRDRAAILYQVLAIESFRFCVDSAHGYVFVGPEHVNRIQGYFREAGWDVYPKPMIWIKREVGQNNAPHAWPSSCYEMFIYVRKAKSSIIKEGMPDWIECPPVSDKIHPYEKPVPLLMNLISRVALPGHRLYDPFAGSGASLEAAFRYKLFATGVDISQEAYVSMLSRMAKLKNTA